MYFGAIFLACFDGTCDLIFNTRVELFTRPLPSLTPGDLVKISTLVLKIKSHVPSTQARKLAPKYIGPFRVVSATEHNVQVKLPEAYRLVHDMYHPNSTVRQLLQTVSRGNKAKLTHVSGKEPTIRSVGSYAGLPVAGMIGVQCRAEQLTHVGAAQSGTLSHAFDILCGSHGRLSRLMGACD